MTHQDWSACLNRAASSSCCILNLGAFFLRRSKFCNFHCSAGNCSRWAWGSSDQSGSARSMGSKKFRCLGSNARGNSVSMRRRAASSSCNATGTKHIQRQPGCKRQPLREGTGPSFHEGGPASHPNHRGTEKAQICTRNVRAHQRGLARFIDAVNSKDVLCQIDANGYDCHGTSPSNKRVS